jgi:hypothetical protein
MGNTHFGLEARRGIDRNAGALSAEAEKLGREQGKTPMEANHDPHRPLHGLSSTVLCRRSSSGQALGKRLGDKLIKGIPFCGEV